MPTLRWQPPAFLLPSWSESQLALLRQQITPRFQQIPLSSASYHSQYPSRRRKKTPPVEPPTGPEEVLQFQELQDELGAAAVFEQRNPFPRRDDQGRRIMLPEDEQGIPLELRKYKQTPLQGPFRKVKSSRHDEPEEFTQRKVYEILRARKTLAVQRAKEARRQKSERLELATDNGLPRVETSLRFPNPVPAGASQQKIVSYEEPLTPAAFRFRNTKHIFRNNDHAPLPELAAGMTNIEMSRLAVSSIEAAETRKKRLEKQQQLLESYPSTVRELLFKDTKPARQPSESPSNEVSKGAGQGTTQDLASLDPLQQLVDGPDGMSNSKLSSEATDTLLKQLKDNGYLSDSAQQRDTREFLLKSIAERKAAAKLEARQDSPDLSWLAADFGPMVIENVGGHQDPELEQGVMNEHYAKYRNIAAVVLNTYDRTLEKEDFMRVVPRGKHMQDWRGFAAPQKVWQVLDKNKLQGRRVFMLLFRTSTDADEYIKRVKHMRTVLGMGPPARASEYDESIYDPPEDGNFLEVEALRNEFSLVTKGQSLDLKKFTFPFPKTIWAIIRGREFGDMNNQIAERRTVLFWLDGYRPDLLDIRNVLARDGEEHGLVWSTLDRIVRWQAGGATPKFSKVPQPGLSGEDEEAEEEELQTEEYGHIYEEAYLRDVLSRWLLTFDNEIEARRFVRLWHMREWPQHWTARRFKQGGESADGARVVANAKMLW